LRRRGGQWPGTSVVLISKKEGYTIERCASRSDANERVIDLNLSLAAAGIEPRKYPASPAR